MADIDTAALRAAAGAAGGCGMVQDCDDPNHEWYGYGELSARLEGGLRTHEAAEFVATFKPSVVLALLDEVDALRASVLRLENALAWIGSDAPFDGSDDAEDAMYDRARDAITIEARARVTSSLGSTSNPQGPQIDAQERS